ncbi:MAG TPA: ribose-5-phosphate isomerase RpiA [Thermoanaerobaculia bacterium]|nr:ribose-5-phosphate isomerase RpiA [Thermoanaerobaculia bacterium]
MRKLEAEKLLAAARAVEEVEDGMLVGLGSGRTAAHAIRLLARRMAEGLRFRGAATSLGTEALARSLGIELVELESMSRLDLAIDGADEIDPRLRAVKGRGGAFLREKLVAAASDRVIAIVDSSKPVEELGRAPLPVEALPFARSYVESALGRLGASVTLRTGADGLPFVTDQGGHVFDLGFGRIEDPGALAAALDAIPGVAGHGLFLTEIDAMVIGRDGAAELVERSQQRWRP